MVAFFPQGVDEKNLDWLFSTISDRINIFDKFCILSLTYRSNGCVAMLAPLRDYLRPKDPKSSPLLRAVKERYFSRMSIDPDPDGPEYAKGRWIVSEDINVEHLLDIFTTIEGSSDEVWEACDHFLEHLFYHKKRFTILKAKIEGLPDGCGPRLGCWFRLALLAYSVGHYVESKQLATHALTHWGEEGSNRQVAEILELLSVVNRMVGLYKEGMGQAKKALEIYGRLGDTKKQADCLTEISHQFFYDQKLDAAEEAALRALDLSSGKGREWQLCSSHHVLSLIYQSKGETEKAVHHNETAIGNASPFGWKHHLFWNHCHLARVFRMQGRFEEAQTRVEHAKLRANNTYELIHAVKMQAAVFFQPGQVRRGEIRASPRHRRFREASGYGGRRTL